MKIMAVLPAVARIESVTFLRVRALFDHAIRAVPAAPIAAASVGVNQPRYIPPTTVRKTSSTGQTSINATILSR